MEAGRDGLGQLIGPAIGAEIIGGVTEANRCFIKQQIDAGKAGIRQLISAGTGKTIKSGAEFREIKISHP